MSKIYAWYFFENRIKNVIRFYLYGEGKFIWGGKTIYKNSRVVVVVNVFVFQKTKIVPIIVVCNNKKFFVKII